MKKLLILALAATLLLGMAALTGAVDVGKAILWDGSHWAQVSLEGKAGYIFGMGNLADFENAAAGPNRPACLSRAFVNDLQKRTVMQIIDEVDKFYQQNPDKLKTSVIEVVLRRCTSACPPESPSGAKKP
jgi:hypothetical protein